MGDRDESLAGHSEADAPAAAPAAAMDRGFAAGDDERYREVRVVGSGGLGTVLLAHDQRLDREVALKRIGPGADERSAAARFAREARITARLDHPGIVPIHDAGITADGRLFYTMRLIRGRALGELAAEATTIAARLALVPALTAACHAVGHAHRRGIVHRDLKPANVMIGDAGETQVVDWGLAEELGVLAAGGPIAGTPAYLAPEVARGEPAGRAADVWALGAMLHEVLTGERRRRGDRDAVLAALRREPEPVRWDPAIPVELRAIAEQAMAAAPAARYPDAEAMAADLEAYRDGRRVRAHDYSAVELAWRAVVALRWPLAIAGALVVAAVVSLALTAHRTEAQRVRAVAAEQVSERARVRAEDALGQALAAAAVAALDRGRAAHAEVLAAYALGRGESPDARGVLAATTAGPRPATSERIDLPGCTNVLPAGYQLALCHLPDRLELWELAPVRRRWRREVRVGGAVALAKGAVIAWTADGELRSLAAADGADVARLGTFRVTAAGGVTDTERTRAAFHDGRDVLVVVAADDTRRAERVCGEDRIAAVAATPHDTWVICKRGKLRRVRDDGQVADIADTGFGVDYRPASALSVSEGEHSAAIGGLGGDVELHDLRPCASDDCTGIDPVRRFRAVTSHAIRAIVDDNDSAIVVADDGDAIRVERRARVEVVALPVDGSRVVALEEQGVVTGGRSWRRWSRAVSAPRRFRAAPGLTVAAVSPDRRLIASAGEDGLAIVYTLEGNSFGGLEVGFGGVLALTFTPDSAQLIVTRTSGEIQTWSMDDRQILLSLSPAPATPPPPPPAPAADDPDVLATARSADGRWLAVATVTGRIDVRELPSQRLIARLHGHRQRATWVAFDGDTLWSGGWDGQLLRWNTRAFTAPAAELQAAAAATWHVTLDEALGRAIP